MTDLDKGKVFNIEKHEPLVKKSQYDDTYYIGKAIGVKTDTKMTPEEKEAGCRFSILQAWISRDVILSLHVIKTFLRY